MSNEEVVRKCKGHVVDIYVPALSVPLWPTKLLTLAQSYYKEKVCRLGRLWEYSCFPVQCPGPLYESGLWTTLILHIAQYAAYMQITLLYLPSSGRMQTHSRSSTHMLMAHSWSKQPSSKDLPATEQRIFILSSFWRSSRTFYKGQWKGWKAPYVSSWLKTYGVDGLNAANIGIVLLLCSRWTATLHTTGTQRVLVVVLRIFCNNKQKVGGFLVCLRDCFNQVKINKDSSSMHSDSTDSPDSTTSVTCPTP